MSDVPEPTDPMGPHTVGIDDPGWPELLDYLHASRGFDFHGYKANTLGRRIRKRISAIGVPDLVAYRAYLEAHPDEFAALFDTILINVTSFFRDPPAWEALRTIALPAIVASKAPEDPIRVWSAGCASGEEPYTIAILLAEQLGLASFRQRVKIYGTDVDEDALRTARLAVYPPHQVAGVPPDLLDRYFGCVDGRYAVLPDLRGQAIFGAHDLIGDAPISRLDLLLCRNTLMYFNAETQAGVLARFHFALNDGGFLLLGRAESLMTHAHAFTVVDPKHRLARKPAGATRSGSRPS